MSDGTAAQGPADRGPISRHDVAAMLGVFAAGLALEVTTTLTALHGLLMLRLSQLGAFFDGHLYIEIAKSFPLPYSADGPQYVGQAPGYPALLYGLRLLTPDALDWGALALLCSWLSAAACLPVLYALARQVGAPPLLCVLVCVGLNPRWIGLGAAPMPEPLAVLWSLLSLLCWLRGSLLLAMLLLSAAALTRFPAILLGAPLALGQLWLRGDRSLRSVATLALPLFVFALYNLYLHLHLPGFQGIFQAHAVWWAPEPTWPFVEFLRNSIDARWSLRYPQMHATWLVLLLSLASVALGFREPRRELWVLPLWIATIVLFHVSLTGAEAVSDHARLAILAWPVCALVLARRLGDVARPAVVALSLCVGVAFGVWLSQKQIRLSVLLQRPAPYVRDAIRQLREDEPRWIIEDIHRQLREQRGAHPVRPPKH